MFGVILVFVVQVFLFGFTRADCDTTCSPCKEISAPADPKYIGNWSLVNPTSSRCDWNISCLYRRDDDGAEMCFCDPGPIVYEECPQFEWGLCYNYTGVDGWNPTSLANNDVASCDKYCLENPPLSGINTFFQLGSTNLEQGKLCSCSQTEPSPDLVVDPSYCDISCPGRDYQTCGGFNDQNNHRYVNIWPTFPNPTETDGACYNSTVPIYTNVPANLTNNDVQACNSHNLGIDSDFTYFALGSTIENTGVECYIGYSAPPAANLVSPWYCFGSPCPGNNDQECGYYQNWNNQRFINVWKKIN